MMNLSLNQRLAFLAFSLSLMALIASIFTDHSLSENITESNYITVLELAENIKNRKAQTLIDLRSKEEFDQFYIPTAINLVNSELLSYDLKPDDYIVIYSERDSLSVQTFSVLKEKELAEIKILKGGVQDWYNRLLYPRMPKEIQPEDIELANRVKSLSTYFGGRSEFVDDGDPLNYYKNQPSNQPVVKSRLVRMGC